MKSYAEENDLLKQPQRMLLSSFRLTYGTLLTPLFNLISILVYSVQKIVDLYIVHRVKCSTVSLSLVLMLGEPKTIFECLVW